MIVFPYRWAILGVTVWLISAAGAAGAVIVLQGPTFTVHLETGRAMTVTRVVYDGFLLVDAAACGSCQGTVVRTTDNVWLGSCHGGEVVRSVSLFIDGLEQPVTPGSAYTGEWFRLEKWSELGGIISLQSSLVLTPVGIREDVTLTTLVPGVSLNVAYGFLSTHSNLFTEALARQWSGGARSQGITARDDNSYLQLGSADIVAQYDPATEHGLATYFASAMIAAGSAFIWDRSCDNKLYYSYRAFPNPIPQGSAWTFHTMRLPFRASEGNWTEAAFSLPFDGDRDGDIDLVDAAAFQACYGESENGALRPCLIAAVSEGPILGLKDWSILAAYLTGPR